MCCVVYSCLWLSQAVSGCVWLRLACLAVSCLSLCLSLAFSGVSWISISGGRRVQGQRLWLSRLCRSVVGWSTSRSSPATVWAAGRTATLPDREAARGCATCSMLLPGLYWMPKVNQVNKVNRLYHRLTFLMNASLWLFAPPPLYDEVHSVAWPTAALLHLSFPSASSSPSIISFPTLGLPS